MRHTLTGTTTSDGISFDKNALFKIKLEDESGINMQQNYNYSTFHIVFDRGRPVDLSSMFAYDNNSYKKGGLSFRLADLTELFLQEGGHEFSLRAADNLNNRTVLDFPAVWVGPGAVLPFHAPVLNAPNPVDPEEDGGTKIQIDLTRTARVTVRVVTPTGKRIRAVDLEPGIGFQWEWDGRDQDGDAVANGVYFVRVTAETEDGSQVVEQIGKAVVLRGAR